MLSGLGSGAFGFAELELEAGDNYYGSISRLAASGRRAVVATGWQGKLSIVDAEDAAAPRVVREVDVAGYVNDLDVADGVALVSLGYDGVQTLAVGD